MCFSVQEWEQEVEAGLAVAGSSLEQELGGLQRNLGEAAGELGDGFAGGGPLAPPALHDL